MFWDILEIFLKEMFLYNGLTEGCVDQVISWLAVYVVT